MVLSALPSSRCVASPGLPALLALLFMLSNRLVPVFLAVGLGVLAAPSLTDPAEDAIVSFNCLFCFDEIS